ncbi:hypothetical protein CEUSTIGMA_g1044.t1 [Chlamydomonas eustigma]|uniref:Uncharacterized protein n=1 Tax=Chlamydomonas eustigma TaxID=1157962 RepID=A0A250WS05_9CHLO|nr:hypothetical protein CEUSTIGMA_g1044.t1 [Chlamydomonas eustigma]|eukprot:GAX73593.1 hypothetical protein CEUSTIGMA_g1044.t1 [Chlamydomonas eustigma]
MLQIIKFLVVGCTLISMIAAEGEDSDGTCAKQLLDIEVVRKSLTDEISTLRTDLTQIQHDLSVSRTRGEALDSEVAELARQLSLEKGNYDAQITNQRSEALTSLNAAVAAAEETARAQIKELENKVISLQQSLSKTEKQSQSQLKQLQNTVAELRQQLSSAQTTAMKEPNLTEALSTISQALFKRAQAAGSEINLIIKDLSAGNTTKLVQLMQNIHNSTTLLAQKVYAFLAKEIDEHAPIVRETVTDGLEKLNQLYQQHVAKAAWVSEVRKHLITANTELKAFITSHIKAQPVLASLNDPVYIQLLAYMVIGAPLLLLFLPVLLWLATYLAPSAKESESATKSSKKSSKKKDSKGSTGKGASKSSKS